MVKTEFMCKVTNTSVLDTLCPLVSLTSASLSVLQTVIQSDTELCVI